MPTLELADDSPPAAGVLDLRGHASARSHAVGVLEDPSGRRRVRMRWLGRAGGACLCVWLAALALSGLGLIPRGVVPLAGVFTAPGGARYGSAPSTLPRHSGPPAHPHDGAATRRPAGAAQDRTSTVKRDRVASDGAPHRRGVGARAWRAPRAGIDRPRGGGITPAKRHTEPGGSPRQTGSAPGPATAPGQSDPAPGKTTAPGQTDSPPGQTDSAPGLTGSAPGSEAVSRTETVPAGSGQGREHSPILGAGQS